MQFDPRGGRHPRHGGRVAIGLAAGEFPRVNGHRFGIDQRRVVKKHPGGRGSFLPVVGNDADGKCPGRFIHHRRGEHHRSAGAGGGRSRNQIPSLFVLRRPEDQLRATGVRQVGAGLQGTRRGGDVPPVGLGDPTGFTLAGAVRHENHPAIEQRPGAPDRFHTLDGITEVAAADHRAGSHPAIGWHRRGRLGGGERSNVPAIGRDHFAVATPQTEHHSVAIDQHRPAVVVAIGAQGHGVRLSRGPTP